MTVTGLNVRDVPKTKFQDGRDKYEVTNISALSEYGAAFTIKLLERVFEGDAEDFAAFDVPENLSDDGLIMAAHELLAFGWNASILKWGHGRSYIGRALVDSVKITTMKTGERTLQISLIQSTASLLHRYYQECKRHKKTCHLGDAIIWATTGGEHDDPDRNCL